MVPPKESTLEACHDSFMFVGGVTTFPAGFSNYLIGCYSLEITLYLQLLPKLHYSIFVVVIVASLTVVDLSRKPDSKRPPKTLKSFLEIAQKTIIDGSLEVLQVLDSSSIFPYTRVC